jgi:hypothetical protein
VLLEYLIPESHHVFPGQSNQLRTIGPKTNLRASILELGELRKLFVESCEPHLIHQLLKKTDYYAHKPYAQNNSSTDGDNPFNYQFESV